MKEVVNMEEYKKKKVSEYVKEAKEDVVFYWILFLLLLFLVGILFLFQNNMAYWILVFCFAHFLLTLGKCITYFLIKKLYRYFLEQKLVEEMNSVYFWNKETCMLTEHFVFLLHKNKFIHFSYDSICEISKKVHVISRRNRSMDEYLYIKTKEGKEYKVLIWTTNMVNVDYQDISAFLLLKNKKVKVVENGK